MTVVFCVWLCVVGLTARSQPTAITYQGRLNNGSNPANGVYDLRFSILDAEKGGNIVGGPITNAGTVISNGLFAATLDFGAGPFLSGSSRWLEIGVRPSGTGIFVTLLPRQLLTTAPFAAYADAAASAGTASNLAPGIALIGNGNGLTNLNGVNIALGTIGSNQLDAATWQAATAAHTNAIQAIGDQRYAGANLGHGWVTPYDCGAVGDGLADDTVALQTWINNASVSNVIAFLPPAKGLYYRITDTLWATNINGIRIMGTGGMFHYSSAPWTTCRIHQTTPGKSGIIFTGWNGAIDNSANWAPDGITIENILITAPTRVDNTFGIAFLGSASDSDCDVIKSVGIHNFGYGLVLGSVADCTVMSCSFGGNNTGALVGMPPELNRATPVINQVQFQTCQLSYNYTNQLWITHGYHITVQNCDVAPGWQSVGIRANGGVTLVENCNFENYTPNPFLVIASPATNPFSTLFVIRDTAVSPPAYGPTPTTYSMVVTNAYVSVQDGLTFFANATSSTNNIGVLEYNDSCTPTVVADQGFPVLFISGCLDNFGERIRTNYPSSNQRIVYNGLSQPPFDMQWTVKNHGTEWFNVESGWPSSEDAPYGGMDDTYDLIFPARLYGFTGNRNLVNVDLLRYSKDLMTTITANTLSVSNRAFFTNDVYIRGLVSAAKGSYFPTNPISVWPAAPSKPGDMYLGNSNGVIYMLTSKPGSTSWTKTNLLATP